MDIRTYYRARTVCTVFSNIMQQTSRVYRGRLRGIQISMQALMLSPLPQTLSYNIWQNLMFTATPNLPVCKHCQLPNVAHTIRTYIRIYCNTAKKSMNSWSVKSSLIILVQRPWIIVFLRMTNYYTYKMDGHLTEINFKKSLPIWILIHKYGR